MPIVTMPDGTNVDFGDLPDDQIRSLIAQKFPNETRAPGYVENLSQMATEGADQFGRGMGQLRDAFSFAGSGAGRNLVPDTPAGRVQSGFSALDPQAPQVFTEGEHRAASRQAAGNVASGFGNVVSGGLGAVYSPLNAALRTYVGQPVESATGIPKEIPELAVGLFGPSAVTRGARAIGRAAASKPSAEDIQAAARAGFQSPVVRNLEVQPSAVQTWSQTLRADLTGAGLDNVNADKTWRILGNLDNAGGPVVTGNNLKSLRESLANVAKERGPDFQPTQDANAATRAMRSLDNFVTGGIAPRDVIAGNPAQAAEVWREARGNYSQFAKIRAADRRQIQAEGNTGSAHSGLNYDNTMRQKMRDVATTPAGRGFTQPGEREAVERIVRGSPERNTLRVVSAMMGGGGGLGAVVSGGTAGLGGLGWGGAAVPAAGMGLRLVENALTARDMDRLSAVLRANSPLARQQGGVRQDIARALMGSRITDRQRNLIAAQLLSRTPQLPGP